MNKNRFYHAYHSETNSKIFKSSVPGTGDKDQIYIYMSCCATPPKQIISFSSISDCWKFFKNRTGFPCLCFPLRVFVYISCNPYYKAEFLLMFPETHIVRLYLFNMITLSTQDVCCFPPETWTRFPCLHPHCCSLDTCKVINEPFKLKRAELNSGPPRQHTQPQRGAGSAPSGHCPPPVYEAR